MGLYLRKNKIRLLKRYIFFIFAISFANYIFSQKLKSNSFTKGINTNELKNLIYVYSSDFFKGRETGKLGQKRAVKFISEFYESINIKEANGTENYFQKMELNIYNNPDFPSCIMSEAPPCIPPIDGTPNFAASKKTIPNPSIERPSCTDGITNILEYFKRAFL